MSVVNHDPDAVVDLAAFIDPDATSALEVDPEPRVALEALTNAAFPHMASRVAADPSLLDPCIEPRWRLPRTEEDYAERLARALSESDDTESVLRRFAVAERLRIALREILPEPAGGAQSS